MKKVVLSFIILLALAVFLKSAYAGEAKPSQASGTGFEGRVVVDGQVVAGARVFVYKSFEDLSARKPFAVSGPTRDDGTWRLDVPGGSYYLAAKKRAAWAKGDGSDGPLAAGDLFSFQGSNPITAVPGRYVHVGFAMVKLYEDVKYADSSDAGNGTLTGVVTYDGQPLAGASVILYLDGKGDFRGMGYSTCPPTGKDGVFRIDFLPESDYYVIARKRANGKNAGPLKDGDFFGYYVANPVTVKDGKVAAIELGMVSKAGEIGKDDSFFRDTGTRIVGRILDKDGKPVEGTYAFAYTEKVMAHKRPEFLSRPADKDGRYVINLSKGGTYYIGSRSEYGDTPAMGEWYGRYEGTGGHSVKVGTGKAVEGVDITVEKILP